MVVEACETGFTPNGEQFAEGSAQEQSGVISSNPYEARLYEFLEQDWSSGEWGIEHFSPSYRMFSYLKTGYDTKLKGYDSGDHFIGQVPEGTSDEAIEAMRNLSGQTAIALGILAYPQWGANQQRELRQNLRTMWGAFFCEEILTEYRENGFIDWTDEKWEHDHYVKLPEVGKKLLKHVCNVVGVPYDTQQDTFYFSTVLNQPEPIVPEE